jgi:hypothetical protein
MCQSKDVYYRLKVAFTVDFSDLVLQQYKEVSKVEPREAANELAGEICTDLTAVARGFERIALPTRTFIRSTVVKVRTKDGKEKHSTM